MLPLVSSLLSIEILLQSIYYNFLSNSYCITVVSENSLQLPINKTFMYISPTANECLENLLNEASEIGCSDYVVRLQEPARFMIAFEKAIHMGNARRSDRKIIFLPYKDDNETRIKMLEVLTLNETAFIANVLLALPNVQHGDCDVYDLVTHQYSGSPEKSIQPYYMDQWNSCTHQFKNNVNLFPHNMSSLNGKIVKVACFTYKPYALLDLDTSLEPSGRDGTEIRIVDEFCRWVNCTIELVQDDEHQWGEIYTNHSGVGVLGNLAMDRADIGITALYSWYEVYRVLDFSAAGIRTAITCVAPSPRLLASWEIPLEPFSWYMWLAVICTFIFASIVLIIAKGCSSDRVFLTTFGMMVSQSQPNNINTTWRIRCITGWLLITGLVLDNAYGGGLASVYTVPKYEKSIDTVQDIVDRNMEWGATHDAWVFSLTLSNEPLVKQLVSQFRVLSPNILKKRSYERNIALSIERLPAGYFAIGDYITKEAMLDLTVMQEDFYYEQCVVTLRKSSPYTEKISQFIGRLHESGLMLAWETQVALKYLNYEVQLEVRLSRSKKDVTNVEPLSFRHVLGIFILYFIGVSLSILFFIVEMLTNRKIKSAE